MLEIETDEQARRQRFRGSPTILIDKVDLVETIDRRAGGGGLRRRVRPDLPPVSPARRPDLADSRSGRRPSGTDPRRATAPEPDRGANE